MCPFCYYSKDSCSSCYIITYIVILKSWKRSKSRSFSRIGRSSLAFCAKTSSKSLSLSLVAIATVTSVFLAGVLEKRKVKMGRRDSKTWCQCVCSASKSFGGLFMSNQTSNSAQGECRNRWTDGKILSEATKIASSDQPDSSRPAAAPHPY